MSETPIHLLWNSHAGSAEANQDVLAMFQSRPDVTVHQPGSDVEACKLVEQVSRNGAQTVIAAGGDGTVNSVVQGLMHAGATSTLGILPLGTGNDFCRTLAIPLDVQQAAELVDVAETRQVDLVRAVNDSKSSHFSNMATGGNTGQFMDQLTADMKQFWGPLVYLRGVVDVLSELICYDLTVQFDDHPPQQIEALNVFVANGRTSGTGLTVAPDASLEDGFMDVVIVRDCEPIQIAGLATDYALGDYRENENILYQRAKKVRIESDPPMAFTADGNLLTKGTVEFEICPSALKVIVGADYVTSPDLPI
ncbi:Diacylglycerol kinase [Symmachiella dynata]|uniref:diacylglycerol/lipid kinase family protein n=1 Tax=Symmachiella dynata TaxID=2527995 RepID=UPI00118AC9AA|nr:diacylglycerol kinase family protein [Symmachiella dynata]QDT50459.1 Diacylglycerol kinase [Symmachiella dynata]